MGRILYAVRRIAIKLKGFVSEHAGVKVLRAMADPIVDRPDEGVNNEHRTSYNKANNDLNSIV